MNLPLQTRVAILGYGKVGLGVKEAIETAPDMELAGVISRRWKSVAKDLPNVKVVRRLDELSDVDVVALCIPSPLVPNKAPKILEAGINTVDSFDMHRDYFYRLYEGLNKVGKEHRAVALIGFGWDPGIDSMVRAIFQLTTPYGVTDTDFGPGMSMGHSVIVRSVPGVRDGISITKPKGGGRHIREVYVVLKPRADFETIKKTITEYPFYFEHDETNVTKVKSLEDYMDTGHGALITRRGKAGKTSNQFLQYQIRVDNPKVTGQIMVAAARASMRLDPGAYTPVDVPLRCFLTGTHEEILGRFV